MTCTQHDLRNLDLATEIDLHPLLDVLLRREHAVIAELRSLLDGRGFGLQLANRRLEGRQFGAAVLRDGVNECLQRRPRGEQLRC